MSDEITRYLTYRRSRVVLTGTQKACDRAELLINHLGLTGSEDTDRKKINALIDAYKRTSVEFPLIRYEKTRQGR